MGESGHDGRAACVGVQGIWEPLRVTGKSNVVVDQCEVELRGERAHRGGDVGGDAAGFGWILAAVNRWRVQRITRGWLGSVWKLTMNSS